MSSEFDPQIRLIPVKQIQILNPRERGKFKFAQIVDNISKLGLKRPITVTHVSGRNGDAVYQLICGQGRLEAYIQLGETEIPALVIEATKEDMLLMSLAENIARRQHTAVELVRQISGLKERGYSNAEIAAKTDLDVAYVRGILQLLAKGEEKLLQAVEQGQIPISVAITIA
ncbi:MAG TPA: ParB N-terminal domain-containing protein, partial [Planctomycetaceae bacterium]|nr:ParB N-terminal domain-containing protein [Planctomycetaceae bacterium]